MDDLQRDVEAVRQIAAVPSILNVIASQTGMRFVAVARVTASRWVACEVLDNIQFGLKSGGELPVETTICNEVRSLRAEVLIDHVAEDAVFAAHPTPAMYGFQSYVSVPIILPDGDIFGTLCAIDPEPRALKGTPAEAMFRLFADLIALHLDANRRLAQSEIDLALSESHLASTRQDFAVSQKDLNEAIASGELREQFIAVLGHDLRNPLASLSSGIKLLRKDTDEPRSVRVLRLMGDSVQRMAVLIDNLLDFARGRLGGGIGLEITHGERIEPVLAKVLNEIVSVHPERQIETHFELAQPIDVDPSRIGQLFSNLLGNAITHGTPDKPIVIHARVVDGSFRLAVCNGGEPIPQAAMERLFQPFSRGEVRPSQQGLGLGLFIASQIAEAHGGTLVATSDADETRFTFQMPVTPAS